MDRRTLLGGSAAFCAALVGEARAAGTSRAPRLRIREIRAVRLKGGFNSRFVRVYTEEGLTGDGEFVDTMGAEYIINHNLNTALKGRDPLRIQAILADLWGYHRIDLGGPPSTVFVHGFGGPYMGAVSGVEMALWDLAGKALGLPVHQLMGGRIRDRVPIYMHANTPKDARKVVDETKIRTVKIGLDYTKDDWSMDKGFEPGKRFGLHMTNDQVDDVVNMVAAFRQELGPHIEIALECHAHYDLETAIQLCDRLEPYRLLWVEEPTTSDDVASMVRVRNNTRVPIAAGENIYTRFGYRPYLEQQALSIIQPDFTKTGGLSEGVKIAAMAETYNVPVAPHGVCSPFGTLAATHVCAVIPNFLVQEFTYYQDPRYTELVEPVRLDADGFLPVPDAPGIGVALRDEVLAARTDPEFKPL